MRLALDPRGLDTVEGTGGKTDPHAAVDLGNAGVFADQGAQRAHGRLDHGDAAVDLSDGRVKAKLSYRGAESDWSGDVAASNLAPGPSSPGSSCRMVNDRGMEPARIRYARSGTVQVAYQAIGDGPLDVVIAPGRMSHLGFMLEHPRFRRQIQAWTAVSRLVLFDKRGTGLSDRPTAAATLEERAEDFGAVMDAVGLERAVVYGQSEGGQLACMFAALYPERTVALATFGAMARFVQTDGHPWGLTREENEALLVDIERSWPSEAYVRGPGFGLGDHADPETVATVTQILQYGASPSAAIALHRMTAEVDIRDVLPTISVPALVMGNTGDMLAPPTGVRAMADAIPGARYLELPGEGTLPGENLHMVIAAVQELVTGERPPTPTTRRLLTILFLDVVGSTERAVELGDAAWRELLATHYARIDRELAMYEGREVDRAGDGLVAVFEGPTRAIRCAQAIQQTAGIEVRAGIHTGEVELDGAGIRGIAVHTAARVCGEAAPGEVLVTSTVRDLSAGAGLEVENRGLRELKGVPEARQLFSVKR